ncbi:hypothetical protein CRYUN_Cryun16bG0027500 [Craigia yunnanensis]
MGISQTKEESGSHSHKHTLFHHYVENKSTKERCDVCNKELYGLVYACEACKFTRHGSCAQKRMPSEITHPSHSMHNLTLRGESSDFLCERCFCNSRGPRYHCYSCLIDVDLACVSATNNQPTQGHQGQIPEGRERKRTRHFSHGEPLALFKYRKTTQQYELDCSWCDKRLSGMSYGCFKGGPYGCKFFLHESCISKISKRLLHPFHPQHYLYVQYSNYDYRFSCNACKRSVSSLTLTAYYACHDCGFYLHISCARLQPTLKHKCHEHYLTYFSRITERCFDCRVCGQDCNAKKNEEGAFYRCVQCNFNIHFRCLPAPPMAKHRYHRHFLILHQGVIEDDSGEYYCDICEEERNPKHHIYYCKNCTYIAHVDCVLKAVSDSEVRKMMDLVKSVQRSNGKFPKLKETGGNNIDRNKLFEMQEIQLLLKDIEQEKKEKKKEKVKYFEEDRDAESSTSSDDHEDGKSDDNDEEGSEAPMEEEIEKEEEEDSEKEDYDKEETSEEEEFENKEGKHEEVDEEKEGEDEENMEEEEEEQLEENKESNDEKEQEGKIEKEDEKEETSEKEEENDKEEMSEEEEFENKEGKRKEVDEEKEAEDEEKMEEEEEEEELKENDESTDEGEQEETGEIEDEKEETSEEEEEEDIEEGEKDKEETSEEEEFKNKVGKHKEVDEEKEKEDEEKMEEEEKNEANEGEESTSINGTDKLSRHISKPWKKPALEIDHYSHRHPLNIFRLTKEYKDGNCNACGQELRGTVYICKTCEFPFHYGLHKACTELPHELQHPLHSQHFLTLLSKFPHSETEWFLCDGCRDFSAGFVYLCFDCPFKIDVKCAVLAAHDIGSQDPKHREKETKLLHFSHEHMLVLGNLVHRSVSCLGCDLPILGPAYCCLDCFYTIHESCLGILPQEIQHPFHPLHPLVAFPEYSKESKCHACKLDFRLGFPLRDFIRYGCLQCKLDLHFVCANSLRRILKSNSHRHNLYYFGTDSQMFLKRFGKLHNFNFMCSACSEMCNGPFYRCVECAINFHLKCVPIPQKIKSKCHIHPLILKNCFVEDDTGEYYCDVCEEKRHPKDHVYYCEKCHGHFVTHIECVLSVVILCDFLKCDMPDPVLHVHSCCS